MILYDTEGFAKPLEMYDLPLTQETDGVLYLGGIFTEPEDVVVGDAGFLLCGQILRQICDWVAGGLEGGGREGDSRRSLRPQAGGVIHIVDVKARGLQFFHGHVSGELVDDGADHFKMG